VQQEQESKARRVLQELLVNVVSLEQPANVVQQEQEFKARQALREQLVNVVKRVTLESRVLLVDVEKREQWGPPEQLANAVSGAQQVSVG